MDTSKQKLHLRKLYIAALLLILFGAATYVTLSSGRAIANTVLLTYNQQKESFPQVDPINLSEGQKKFLTIVRAEYETQPPGTKYSEGVVEPWCADFVSWVMNEQGKPFSNPNSESWRIPGVLTLRSYFIAKSMYHVYGDGYIPKTGDIALYDGNGPFGQHTNFVLKVENGKIYTLGGNEAGRIHVQTHTLDKALGLVGFGSVLYE